MLSKLSNTTAEYFLWHHSFLTTRLHNIYFSRSDAQENLKTVAQMEHENLFSNSLMANICSVCVVSIHVLTKQGDDWLMVLSYFIIPYGVCDHTCAWHSWFTAAWGRCLLCFNHSWQLQVISLSFLCVWNPSHGCFSLFTRSGVFSIVQNIPICPIHIYGTYYIILVHVFPTPLNSMNPHIALPSVIIISNVVNIQYSAMYGVQWWAVIRIMLHMFRCMNWYSYCCIYTCT